MADSLPAATSESFPSSTLSTSFTPTGTRDFAGGSPYNDDDDDDDNNTGSSVPMGSYYFVFLMLAICIIGIVIFLNFRRRRKRRLQHLYGREDAYAQDPAAARGRRHYWTGRWGSQNVSREEGLNEHGEAPPPYMPKSSVHDPQRDGAIGGQAASAGPAVPMQTLSRDDAGMRPPEYDETDGHDDMMRPARPQGPGASASQQAEMR